QRYNARRFRLSQSVRPAKGVMNPSLPLLQKDACDLGDAVLARRAFVEVDDSLARAGGKYMSKVHLLPPDWRFVYVMQKLNDEVNNGGFHQFFVNMGGVFDPHLADDISLIPHANYQRIVQRAYDIYANL